MDDFENMLINLKVLQSLNTSVRLDTTETLFRIHSTASWIPAWARRWWAQQSRLTDVTRIQTLYKDAIGLVNEEHTQSLRIKTYVSDSRKGLVNLKSTYRNDPTVIALIDVILDSVSNACHFEPLDTTGISVDDDSSDSFDSSGN